VRQDGAVVFPHCWLWYDGSM